MIIYVNIHELDGEDKLIHRRVEIPDVNADDKIKVLKAKIFEQDHSLFGRYYLLHNGNILDEDERFCYSYAIEKFAELHALRRLKPGPLFIKTKKKMPVD